uniref:Uncharacterized protein n=1 Tax=Arundo donax TaxID=35708 RepID=A0A0A9AQ19_ARUDO
MQYARHMIFRVFSFSLLVITWHFGQNFCNVTSNLSIISPLSCNTTP